MTLQWKEDGEDHWKATIDTNRDAHISETESGSFRARITGGDPGTGVLGHYPTLEIAQMRFEPNGQALADAAAVEYDPDAGDTSWLAEADAIVKGKPPVAPST